VTGPAAPQPVLHRALSALRLEREPDLARGLLAASSRAAESGDWRLAWLLADRLVRIGLATGEAGLLLRAAAHARLGEPASAQADLDQARALAPDHPVLLALDMQGPDPALRRDALEQALLGADDTLLHQALSHLAASGHEAVLVAREVDDAIAITLHWNGPSPLRLGWSDGERREVFADTAGQPSRHPDWAFSARLALGWPGSAPALSFFAEAKSGSPAPLRLFSAPAILYPAGETVAPGEPVAADGEGSLLILLPVYGDKAATLACLDSLFESGLSAARTRILVIDDATPDPALAASLRGLAQDQRITLLRNPLNLGFARSINRGLACRRAEEDVLLLNADTLVPPGAVARLAAAVAEPSIGTATPLSNTGEDTSFPRRFSANPMPEMAELVVLDRLAQQANPGSRVDLPNGVGFCLYVRRDVLAAVGPLSTDYGRGYYEDVDFCLRVRRAGYRNVCAADVVVGHHGSRSFGRQKAALIRRNQAILEARFPDYRAQARAYRQADPLREPLGRLEDLWLKTRAHRLHLVLVPQALPDWLAEQMLDHARARGLEPVLGRIARPEGRLEIALDAMDRLPANLTLRLPAAASGDPGAMRALLLAHRWAGVTLVDDGSLPGALVAACHSLPQSVAASCLAPLPQRPDCASPPPAAPVPPDRAPSDRVLAVILDAQDPPCGPLLAALGRHDPRLAFALLGAQARDSLELEALAWPAGAVPRREIADWLKRAGISACLVASRRYGLADEQLTAWLEAGLHVAVFDGSARLPRQHGPFLRLPADLPEAEIAPVIMAWLGDPAP